jgi:dTDP-4-amino-4,6-dideoxygalactose transaminase
MIGLNARLDEIQAAVLRVKLPHLDGWNERRRQLAARYDDALRDTPVVAPTAVEATRHVYHHYAVLAPRRDELAAALRESGIGTGIHYPVPCHRQPAIADAADNGDTAPSLPNTERIAEQVLSLPMYPELTEAQVDRVAAAIRRFYQSSS